MFLRSLLAVALAAASAEAFTGPVLAPRVALRSSGACSRLRMVDWSEPVQQYNGAGADRGQVNKAEQIKAEMEARLMRAKEEASKQNSGWKSEYDPTGTLKEGDRDPITGRLILDPLKIPTSEQGAPASFAEYMERRAKQMGGKVVDAMGNDLTDIRPSAPVHEGSWGAPQAASANDDWLGSSSKNTKIDIDPEMEEWNRKRAEERAREAAEAEARMAKWMADAAAKNQQGQ
eukprot:CAMPEP_0206253694 /NCGR_PEP_ID=MMETSP0047_2-20121206/23291_1 /ASSEMBLY_ACC=CAM_ASM_000192 /TAXON_ID=195065 /ORGANISM="Chroomonas mesostigmatica_cf, Strain CCMP1168" /LENGTH=231 /DNA_ID=CAMNT_0053679925 /DNA_START=9 /DNA_END=704 /DNA_ORIENTATION=-